MNVDGPALVDGEEPVIVFEDVSLAFDEKVVLSKISFALLPGRMKVFLGASGSGKSTVLRLVLGLLRPDAGRIWVAGQRVDTMSEAGLMGVRAQLGMIFQEGALFDSLTVRENVGYRLYEESAMPERRLMHASRKCSGSSDSAILATGCRPSCRVGRSAVWRLRGR